MHQEVTIDVRRQDSSAIMAIHGDLTAGAEAALSDAYARAADNSSAVILNFEGLEYMNSGGIGLLVTLLIRANRQKRRLMICGLSEHYRHIFQITRLDDAIHIYDTEADALRAAGSSKA